MNWTTLLKERAEAAYRATVGLVQKVDDGRLTWRPPTGDNWLSAGQLLLHIATACGPCCRGFITNEWQDLSLDPKWKHPEGDAHPTAAAYLSVKSRNDALALLEDDRKLTHDMIAKAGEHQLETKRLTAPWGGPELNLGTHFFTAIQHLDKHTSQLFYYLKLQGKNVTTADLWGIE